MKNAEEILKSMAVQAKRGDQINWNQVFYFSEIAAAGSVKDAAEKLGLSPSTLSEHLGQLELDLDIKLFQRQHRKLTLTKEGAQLFHSAREMFVSGKRFIEIISPVQANASPISIGIVPGSAYTFAHRIIGAFIKQNDLAVNILRFQHDELENALLEAKVEFGFTDRRSNRKDIVQSTVMTSELRFFVSSKLPRKSLKDFLKELPLVICRSESGVPSAIEAFLETLGLSPKNVIVSEFPSLVESLCREGSGISVLGRRHFESDRSVQMLALPRSFPELTEKLYVTWAIYGEKSEAIKKLKPLLIQKGDKIMR